MTSETGPTGPIDMGEPTGLTGSSSPTGTNEPTGPTGSSGPTGTNEPTGPTGSSNLLYPTPPKPDILTIDDILNDKAIRQAKEEADKQLILSIGTQSPQAFKPNLIQWATAGFPNAYTIYQVNIQPPDVCLDGVSRSLPDYITYVSGNPINYHVDLLAAKFQGIIVSFANISGIVSIVVSKP
jgi:hypothetical protein